METLGFILAKKKNCRLRTNRPWRSMNVMSTHNIRSMKMVIFNCHIWLPESIGDDHVLTEPMSFASRSLPTSLSIPRWVNPEISLDCWWYSPYILVNPSKPTVISPMVFSVFPQLWLVYIPWCSHDHSIHTSQCIPIIFPLLMGIVPLHNFYGMYIRVCNGTIMYSHWSVDDSPITDPMCPTPSCRISGNGPATSAVSPMSAWRTWNNG